MTEPNGMPQSAKDIYKSLQTCENAAELEKSTITRLLLVTVLNTFWEKMLDAITEPAHTVGPKPQESDPDTRDHPRSIWAGHGTEEKMLLRCQVVMDVLEAQMEKDRDKPAEDRGWLSQRQIKKNRGISKTMKAQACLSRLIAERKVVRKRVSNARRGQYEYRVRTDTFDGIKYHLAVKGPEFVAGGEAEEPQPEAPLFMTRAEQIYGEALAYVESQPITSEALLCKKFGIGALTASKVMARLIDAKIVGDPVPVIKNRRIVLTYKQGV